MVFSGMSGLRFLGQEKQPGPDTRLERYNPGPAR